MSAELVLLPRLSLDSRGLELYKVPPIIVQPCTGVVVSDVEAV